MISRLFIFYTIFYSITAALIVMFAFAVPVNPNCANTQIQTQTQPFEKPSTWDFIGSAWDIVVNVATLGVGTRCDTPGGVTFAVTLFNLMSLSVLGVGVAFFIRGSS